jgi:hypothetical protein
MQRSRSDLALPFQAGKLTFGAIAKSDEVEDETEQRREPRVEDGFMTLSEGGFLYSVMGRSAIGTAGGGSAILGR